MLQILRKGEAIRVPKLHLLVAFAQDERLTNKCTLLILLFHSRWALPYFTVVSANIVAFNESFWHYCDGKLLGCIGITDYTEWGDGIFIFLQVYKWCVLISHFLYGTCTIFF